MKGALGFGGITLGFMAAALGVVTMAVGIHRRDGRIMATGRQFVFMVLLGALLAAGVMEWALVTHDFSIAYVVRNHARATPLLYTVAALWGALEGSILLWALILAGYLTVTVRRLRARASEPLVAWATLVGLVVAAFFFALMLGPANPFRPTPGLIPKDGLGPNPLLQNHVLMAIHPPMLYLGYVGMTIPFSFAVAALATGRVGEGWLLETRRATLVAWAFLSVGIVLGAWWSYEVLGWGGYWAWDPVENASFIPWLTATAFLHSVVVQERRGMLRVWNLSLIIATFCLTILGTFLTRSGVLNSVHAFSQSSIGAWLLTFLGLAAATGIGLIAWRGDRLRTPGRIDSPVSREGAFLANNLLFAGFAFVVLLGTVFPLLVEALRNEKLSVGEPYFDRMTIPIGLALLFLMAVAPALPWRAASGPVLRRRLAVPAWVGALTMAACAVLGARGVAEIVAFGLGAFAVAGIVRQYALGVAATRRASGGGWPGALRRTVAGNRRLYGGLVVHFAVVVIAVALAASMGYTTKREFHLVQGQRVTVQSHHFTYLGSTRHQTAQKDKFQARIRVERGGHDLGVYAPALSIFPNSPQAIGTPSVRTGLLRDIYLTLVSSPDQDGRITLGVQIGPLVVWLWIGGGILAFGTAVAVWPARRIRRRSPGSGPDPLAPPAPTTPSADEELLAEAPA
ncbi:MAG: cytochrome c-type biosis protein CcmF [Actinomycetota bacterium]|nr:cytochrome c-type biosis protein CcmF [Actinomycetota bacterium]